MAGANEADGAAEAPGAAAEAHFRAHPRRRVRMRVVVRHAHHGWEREAEVFDVSIGGAFLVLDESLTVGDALSLTFVAPTLWDPLTLEARVAWALSGTRPAGTRFGVSFQPREPAAAFSFFELASSLAPSDD